MQEVLQLQEGEEVERPVVAAAGLFEEVEDVVQRQRVPHGIDGG